MNQILGSILSLGHIYFQHNMQDWVENRNRRMEEDESPKIICSEGIL